MRKQQSWIFYYLFSSYSCNILCAAYVVINNRTIHRMHMSIKCSAWLTSWLAKYLFHLELKGFPVT